VTRPTDAARRLAALPLAAEVLISYAQARWAMRGQDLPRAVGQLRRGRQASRAWRALASPRHDARRLGAVVDRTLTLLPIEVLCLTRALVLIRVLSRRGVRGSLVIGVLPTQAAQLSAHAWVELDDIPLLRPADPEFGRLITL
jgi:hypothetical protein